MILQEAVPVPERSCTFSTQILARVAYSPYLKVNRYDLCLFFLSPSCPSIEPKILTRQRWKAIPYQVEIDQLSVLRSPSFLLSMSGVCRARPMKGWRLSTKLSTGQGGNYSVQQIFLIPWINPTPCSFPPLLGYLPYRLPQSVPLCINSICQHKPVRAVADAVSIGREAICSHAKSDIWSAQSVHTDMYNIILSDQSLSTLFGLERPKLKRVSMNG